MLDQRILSFYTQLNLGPILSNGVEVMNPYLAEYTLSLCRKFYKKYYHDKNPRTLLLGINPGRFGSGLTGISFTDPIKLRDECGIDNSLKKKPELSADFIYRMIAAYGGPAEFYKRYLISAVSPLGFTKEGKNINYYDETRLQKAVTPFIIESINHLVDIAGKQSTCFCIGEGKNYVFLEELNGKHHWFGKLIPLPHPRFIMQYKRKQLERYIDIYLTHLGQAEHL